MFDYGNANEAQKEAINTVEGPVLQQVQALEKHLHLLRGLFILFKNVIFNQNK